MNKIYKVRKNRHSKREVISELAKDRGQPKKLSSLIKTTLGSTVALCLGNISFAETVVNNDSNFVITGDNYNRFSDGKISIVDANDDITVTNSGNITSNGLNSAALFYNLNQGTSLIIKNTGNLETNKKDSRGIVAIGQRQNNVKRTIEIDNQGDITINEGSAAGIVGLANDAAVHSTHEPMNTSLIINNSGNININGRGSNDIASGKLPAGIVATSLNGNTGDITVINSGNITSTNTGIRSWHQGIGDINIDNSGDISIHSTSWGNAIYAARSVIAWKPYFLESRGNINIKNSGKISVREKEKYNVIQAVMINERSDKTQGIITGDINIYNTGDIVAEGNKIQGIVASMQGSADNTGTITINNDSSINTSGNNSIAINAFSRDGDIFINLDENSRLIGGDRDDGAAIDLTSAIHQLDLNNEQTAVQVINNKGVISSINDRTIVAHRSREAGGETIVNNDGIINGYVDLSTTKDIDVSLTNRENIKRLDSNGTAKFNNAGIWNIRDRTSNSGIVINRIGTTNHAGTINNSGIINIDDIVNNSVILQNANLNNSSIIDFGKNSAETTLTVDGNYHSENGFLNIHIDVDKGQTDKLVVNGNASGESNVNIYQIGEENSDAESGRIDNIIKIIGDDRDSVWTVKEIINSAYDYTIGKDEQQHGVYHLFYTNAFSDVKKSPVAASVLANQLAAIGMFHHSAYDRATSIYAPDSNIWMRSSFNREKGNMFDGHQKIKMKTSVLEMGVDLISSDRIKAGVYAGYGHSSTDTNQNNSHRKGDSSVSGYNVGVYGHWNNRDNSGAGLFVDGWAQYSWFKNKTNIHLSDVRNYSNRYDGHATSISAEVGYGFILHESSNRNWLIEPHAQLGYTWSDTDNFSLGDKGRILDINADGAQIRIGAVLYGNNKKDSYGVLPFVEANWLYDSSTPEAKINTTHVKSDISKNQFEAKLGLNGNFSKALSGYAHINGRFGSNSHSNVGAKIGLNYSF